MIVAGAYGNWAIYVIGPIVGGVLAALLYDRFLGEASAPTTAVARAAGNAAEEAR